MLHLFANDLQICAALAKAQQQLLDSQEREYVLSQVKAAKGKNRKNKYNSLFTTPTYLS